MVEGGALAGEADAPFGFDNLVMQERLLTGIRKGKGTAGKRIVMPQLRSADFKFLHNLGWMQAIRDAFGSLVRRA